MQNEKSKILIIDDEESICDIISDYLELRDFNCYTSNSVEEAIKILKDQKIDCVVSDIRMRYFWGQEELRHREFECSLSAQNMAAVT